MSLLKLIIKIVIVAIAFYYILHGLDFATLIDSFLNYSFLSIILSTIVVIISVFLASYRLKFISKHILSFKASNEATWLCLGINNITPAKLGEIAKTFYLKKFYNYPISKSMPLMIIERLFDVFILAILILILSYYIKLSNIEILFVISFILFTIFISILLKPKIFLKLILNYSPTKSKKFLSNSLKTVARVTKFEWFFMLIFTIIMWFSYYMTVVIFEKFGTNFNLTYFQLLVVLAMSSIGMAIPSTPGGVGVYEAGVVFALTYFGINKEDALSFAIISHSIQYISTTIVAVIIILKRDFNFKRINFGKA